MSENITSRTEIIIPAQMKLMDGRVLPTDRLPKTICYIVCTGKGQRITSKQAERLRKWLTSMFTNHLLIQRTKPAQANIGIYVGNAKSFAELPEELVTTKLRKLQRAGKPIISLAVSS